MWSLMSAVGPSEPSKMSPIFPKGAYSNTPFCAILGGVSHFATFLPDKPFPTFKKDNQSMPCQNYQKPVEVNSSRTMQETPKNTNNQCNSKKKKKKRRRRRKKKNNQQQSPATLGNPVENNCGQWRRTRQISTTESEDSFIVFFDDKNGDDRLSEVSENDTVTTEDLDSCDSIIPHKKVRFANERQLCEIHPMVKWSFAYQAARRGPWEEYARDRDRFRKRVANTETEIGHVFTPEHRSRIFKERFA